MFTGLWHWWVKRPATDAQPGEDHAAMSADSSADQDAHRDIMEQVRRRTAFAQQVIQELELEREVAMLTVRVERRPKAEQRSHSDDSI